MTAAKELPSTWLPLKSTDWFLCTYMLLKTKLPPTSVHSYTPNQNHSDHSGNGGAELSLSWLFGLIASLSPITLCFKQFHSLAPVMYFCELSLANKIAGPTSECWTESGDSLILKQFPIVTFYWEAPFLGDWDVSQKIFNSAAHPIRSNNKTIVGKKFKYFHALFMFGAFIL